MARLNKDDLAQMNKNYFQSLEKQRLVEVATNLHQLAVEQWEKLEQNSRNSSRPPSSDNPYQTETENKEDVNVGIRPKLDRVKVTSPASRDVLWI